jgi:hypothetical protein
MVRLLMRCVELMAVELFCTVSAFPLAPLSIVRQPHLFSAKSSCISATKISDWDGQVSEPPEGGRRCGPNWSVNEALPHKQVDQKAGALVFRQSETRLMPTPNYAQTCLLGSGSTAGPTSAFACLEVVCGQRRAP